MIEYTSPRVPRITRWFSVSVICTIDEKLPEYIESILKYRENYEKIEPTSIMMAKPALTSRKITGIEIINCLEDGKKKATGINIKTDRIALRIQDTWHLNLMHSDDLRKMLKFVLDNREKANEERQNVEKRRYIDEI